MTRRRRVAEVEVIEMESPALETARARTWPIHRSWALNGGSNLEELVLSVYLQGVWDGWQACERQNGLEGGTREAAAEAISRC